MDNNETSTQPAPSKKLLLIGSIVLILIVGAIYFLTSLNGENESVQGTATEAVNEVVVDVPAETTTENEDETEAVSEVKTFEVESTTFSYTPNEIRVNEGDTVRIVLSNANGVHDWVVDEFNARTEIINAGETDEIEFVADKAGTYEFYCSVGNHREMGMVGTLIVE